jgi:hypothetical protein
MTVQQYLGQGVIVMMDEPMVLFGVSSPPPAPVGPAPTWGEIASALGQMKSGIEKIGWGTGSLLSFTGLCMLGSFVFRNSMYHVNPAEEQESRLGQAVGDHLWETIKMMVPVTWMASATSWNNVIHFNDAVCGSREMALLVLDAAWKSALERAGQTGEEVPPEVEATPAAAAMKVNFPDDIPGEFIGFLESLEPLELNANKVAALAGT